MKFPFFASFIVFCIWLGYEIHKHRNMEAKADQEFWEKEAAANSTRRKSLDNLAYIRIPFETLPMENFSDDPVIKECHETLKDLSAFPIVNLTGISNTDLKLTYGAPNINLLSEYDANFEQLITTLQNWAALLLQNWGEAAQACPEEERKQAAKTILAYAVSAGSDIAATYERLTKLYLEYGEQDKIPALKEKAEKIRSLTKGRVLAMLEEAEKNGSVS